MSQKALKIIWRAEFETGNTEIDYEHREIVHRLNAFFAFAAEGGTDDEALNKLADVYAWISAHFALEETIMRAHKYDQFEDHKKDHELLLDQICDIMDDCKAGAFTGKDIALQERLEAWFVGHFKMKDSRLHKMIPHGV
ncbi:MAG: hemerythrin family protein [Alphaproteobacteria bacterium]|jgi:hemerythrin|nr:hemerythrin family protein [Alphaproteobacteria bacterium]MBT7943973.1 hemerythrin family protein [Alphaproteobacteria bacterium]